MPIAIRPCPPAAGHAVLHLLSAAGLPTADLAPDRLDGFIVATDGGTLLGAAALEIHGESGLLRSVAVAPGERSRGIGGRLVDHLEGAAARRGLRDLYLLTTTAAEWFARRGWERIDRAAAPAPVAASMEFAALCPSSAVCMRKVVAGQGPAGRGSTADG